jgi:hypothetical protein
LTLCESKRPLLLRQNLSNPYWTKLVKSVISTVEQTHLKLLSAQGRTACTHWVTARSLNHVSLPLKTHPNKSPQHINVRKHYQLFELRLLCENHQSNTKQQYIFTRHVNRTKRLEKDCWNNEDSPPLHCMWCLDLEHKNLVYSFFFQFFKYIIYT